MPTNRETVLAWLADVRRLMHAMETALAVPMARTVRDALVAALGELEDVETSLDAALERMEREAA